MTDEHEQESASSAVLDRLESELVSADPAAAPEIAEEIAKRLGETLDKTAEDVPRESNS